MGDLRDRQDDQAHSPEDFIRVDLAFAVLDRHPVSFPLAGAEKRAANRESPVICDT